MDSELLTIRADVEPSEPRDMSRRELLGYAWLAALGVLGLETGVAAYRFARAPDWPADPKFGDSFAIGAVEALPPPGSMPMLFRRGRFWWVNTDAGALALFWACTRAPCVFDWKPSYDRFICPCCGAMFTRDGAYFRGPAPRDLDRFVIRAIDQSGREVARTNRAGDPLVIPRLSIVVVETGRRILGAPVESVQG